VLPEVTELHCRQTVSLNAVAVVLNFVIRVRRFLLFNSIVFDFAGAR